MTGSAKPSKKSSVKKTARQRDRAQRLFRALVERYPDAHCALNWTKPHELLIATILSAQSTDVGVNKATPALFRAFATVAAFAAASVSDIEPFVKTVNFWRNKARAISESMKTIQLQHGGNVPATMPQLLALRGVARKTANVVLGNAFDINEGVVVDTHVGRLAQRMALSKQTDPVKIEQDLMALFPRAARTARTARTDWCRLSHLLIAHGRAVCKARGNTCSADAICREFCSAGKPQARSKVAGKATTHKATTHKATTHKATTHKATTRKATVRKATVRKATVRKATTHKATTRTAATHNATTRTRTRTRSKPLLD